MFMSKEISSDKTIKIGMAKNLAVSVDVNRPGANHSVLIQGKSGMGKTFFMQMLAQSLLEFEIPCCILDLTGSFDKNQTQIWFGGTSGQEFEHVNVYRDGVALDIFQKNYICESTREKDSDLAGRLADILAFSFRLGEKQKDTIYVTIKDMLSFHGTLNPANPFFKEVSRKPDGSALINLHLLRYLLKENADETSERLIARLNRMIDGAFLKVESRQDLLETKAQILCMKNLTERIKTFLADLILYEFWNYAKKFGNSEKPIYIMIDEFQNLRLTADSPLMQILCEGRKFGLHLVLSTQFVQAKYDKSVELALKQVGSRIIFRPSDGEIASIVRELAEEQAERAKLKKGLLELKKAEAYVVGNCFLGESGIPCSFPIKTKIGNSELQKEV